MKIAIIGLSRSGKTIVFRSLAAGPLGSKDAHGQGIHVGNVKVPDPRLDRLGGIFKPPKVVHADIDFMDVHGSRADQKGTDFTPQIISEIRNVDALIVVVRAFNNPAVPHPLDSIEPLRDLRNIEADLCLGDLIQIEARFQRMAKERPDAIEKEALLKAKACLDEGRPLRLLSLNDSESKSLAGFSFLSRKPSMALLNIGENDVGGPVAPELLEFAEKHRYTLMPYCAEIELEISELAPEEQTVFLADMGLNDSGRDRLIRKVYEMLHLISFFTIADTEIRSWSIPKGTRAVAAAGKVHSDMERGFIRAEVIQFDDFIKKGTMHAARESGHLRLEGKDYEVRDGDIIKFRFHV